MALSINGIADSTGPVQVVRKVQDQAKQDGASAVALIQAAQVPVPRPSDPVSPSGVGERISLRI